MNQDMNYTTEEIEALIDERKLVEVRDFLKDLNEADIAQFLSELSPEKTAHSLPYTSEGALLRTPSRTLIQMSRNR